MSSYSIIIIIYCFIYSVISLSNNQTKITNSLNINLDYGENDTIILWYNLTTNYSYFITFREFGDEQLKFGLFLSTNNKSEEHSIEIFHQNFTLNIRHLFIICFHFILQVNNLDIQCKDIRLFKKDEIDPDLPEVFLPSYNPLFVPMMYALSVIMLLPVIIQNHRRKKALTLQRRTTLRRLSIQIAQDDQNPQQNIVKQMLSRIAENGDLTYENIPMEMKLVSDSSTKLTLDDMNDNNVTFTLENLQPFAYDYDDNDTNEQLDVNADDCIAHLLDNTPWNTPNSDQPLTPSLSRHPLIRDSATAIKEQHVPTTIPFHDDDDDDLKPILITNKHPRRSLYKKNQVFFETDV
ncbi:unnamed protein product [Adineta steineri]|uniref:Uncharacterized protein n=1 Tax=Adineta steineri TaxID=433720 RepID=A0A814KIS5_9BILA|nr:unnamed protein product [Adineta steineri]